MSLCANWPLPVQPFPTFKKITNMVDEDYESDSGDFNTSDTLGTSGASSTLPMLCSAIRKDSYVVIQGRLQDRRYWDLQGWQACSRQDLLEDH